MKRSDEPRATESTILPTDTEVASIHAEIAALGGTDPFAAAVQATRMPMIITNPRLPDNPIVFVNNAFCRQSGYDRAEIVGRNCRFLQGPATDRATVAAVRDAIEAGVSIEIELQNHRKDGSTFWNRLLVAPVHDAKGNLIYFFASQLDITLERERISFLQNQNENLEARVERRTRELTTVNAKLVEEAAERQRVENALRQAQKMEAIGQLTGGIAHDFNNMLQGVTSGIELAQRRVAAGEIHEVPDLLGSAMDSGRRAAELTRRLLAFGRKQALMPKRVEVDELARGMASLIQQTVGPAITVELRLQDGCWAVRCDPNQLESAILNLAINARDAMLPAGGTLLIATAHVTLDEHAVGIWEEAEPGDYVQITVTDTGTGMTPDVMAHAFEPFFTTKPDGQGTGLGLSQIHGFIHQSAGVAQLESQLGSGTSVHLCLPRFIGDPVDEAAASGQGRPADAAAGRCGTVLLVEDEIAIRRFAAIALRELGYQVLEAGTGRDGLTLLEEASQRDPVDLLVTDVGLPGGLNGRQLAEAARAMLPDLPILLITGYAGMPDTYKGGRLDPGIEVLGKPFELDTLSERVRGLLDGQATPRRRVRTPPPAHMPR